MSLSRQQLFNLIGIGYVVEPEIQKAYAYVAQKEWEEQSGDNPHGYKWHTRLHASSFPGSTESCKRKLLYGLLDIPKSEPTDINLTRYGEVGLDAEARLVDAWYKYGILLSAHTDDQYQTNLKDESVWLSGNMDAAILPFKKTSPHIVEVKSRGIEKVLAMKAGTEPCDPSHENQCRSYIEILNENPPYGSLYPGQKMIVDAETWQIISPIRSEHQREFGKDKDRQWEHFELGHCTSGSVLYIARDNPNIFHEFVFEHDPDWWNDGKERLTEVKDCFIEETIPQDLPMHEDGKAVGWSKGDCAYCPLKRDICKPDHKEGIVNIKDSNALRVAKEINENYSYEEARKRVLNAWD